MQSVKESIDAIVAGSGLTIKEITAVSGQGLRPSSLSTVAVRVEGALLAGARGLDQHVVRADQIVNGSQPIGQGLLAAAGEQLTPHPSHPNVISHDGLYIPSVADRVAANAQRPVPAGLANGPGGQSAMDAVNRMQASGDICHQTSGRVSGASYVVNTCVGGLSSGSGGKPQVSVQAGITF